jgi:dipeptidyl aminopeptidase/acylaminoacyl peptidase
MLSFATAGLAQAAPRVPFSIADVLHAPYPTSLITSSKGNEAAWVFDDAGVRNIWVADAAQGAGGHAITTYTADDGFDIGDLDWSPDTHLIAFTRGQTLEDDRAANVDSAPIGPMPREIWVVAATGGTPRKIGTGHSPSFSPDGSLLIFLDKNRVMSVDPNGNGEPKPLITDQGNMRATVWSPDGRRLAFVSNRGSHSLIGIYDVAAKSIIWLAPTFDLDESPVFSPDGSHVAFIRVPSEKSSPFLSRRAGLPWSIRVADVATGAGQEVWRADQGDGSVFQPTLSERNLLWAAGNRLVFPWEKTGWLQPYAVSVNGGVARALTNGDFETAYMTLSADRRTLIYASNQSDIDRLHVWAVDPAGGAPKLVASHDQGIEAFPATGADGAVFALRSTATSQLMPVVAKGDQWQSLANGATPASFPTSKLVTPQSVTFRASDGQTTYGQIFLPPAGAKAKHAAVLFFHGGPPRQMLVGFHYMSAYSWMYALNEYLAAEGYVVLSVNYRGGIGYGMKYREADGFGMGGGTETYDMLGAISYLKSRDDVDSKRIGVWGGSYGGLMTALTLARASDSVAVGVDYAGVYDWASMFAAEGHPIEDPEERKLAIASSPVATIANWHSPVLVVQADDDRNVPPQQSSELIQDLRAHHVPFDQVLIPNEVHDLTRYASWLDLFEATDAYLDAHLHPGASGK